MSRVSCSHDCAMTLATQWKTRYGVMKKTAEELEARAKRAERKLAAAECRLLTAKELLSAILDNRHKCFIPEDGGSGCAGPPRLQRWTEKAEKLVKSDSGGKETKT